MKRLRNAVQYLPKIDHKNSTLIKVDITEIWMIICNIDLNILTV